MKLKKIHLIVNPASGQDEAILNTVHDVFDGHEVDWELSLTKSDEESTREIIAEAIHSGADAVMAYGGDGTISQVANVMIEQESEMPLAILPGGTSNAIATELDIPLDLREAIELFLGDKVKVEKVDVGRANERIFLLRVGLGLVADVIQGADRETKDRFGVFGYIYSLLDNLREPEEASYSLSIDGETIETKGIGCIVANIASFGRVKLKLPEKVDPADGLLDVFVLPKDTRSILLALADLARPGQDSLAFEYWRGKQIQIHSDPPQQMQMDGDLVDDKDVNIEVLPGAIRLVLPEQE